MALVTAFAVTSCQSDEELPQEELPQEPTNESGDTTDTPAGNDIAEVKWVQLWADGPKFAECNVGAENNKPEDYGGYYTWGGKYKNDGITWLNDHYGGTGPLFGNDDTATNLWGSKWRMPTNAEFQALVDSCSVEDVLDPNDNTKLLGKKFIGKGAYSSNSVFLPAAGYCKGSVLAAGKCGAYWSSTGNGSDNAYSLVFNSDTLSVCDDDNRNYGFSVRAVLAE